MGRRSRFTSSHCSMLRIGGLSTGMHAIDVTRDDYDSHHGEVIVARNETTIARVELLE